MHVRSEYPGRVEQLRSTYLQGPARTEAGSVLEASMISASLYHLRPDLDIASHDGLAQQMKFFQKWAALDQDYLHLLDEVRVHGAAPSPGLLAENVTPQLVDELLKKEVLCVA